MGENGMRNPVLRATIIPSGFWKTTGIVTAIIAALILVLGYFHSRAKVPFPTDPRLEFPADLYASASERFTQPAGCKLVDQAYFTKKAIALLEQEIPADPAREIVTSTFNELREKLVIVRLGRSTGGNFQVLYNARKADLENKARALESRTRTSSYGGGYEARAERNKIRLQSAGLEALRRFLAELDLKCDLGDLPYTDIPPNIQLVCGYLTGLSRDMKFTLRNPAPVLDSGFLTKAGIPVDAVDGVDFNKELGTWGEMLAKAKEKHRQASMALQAKLEQEVRRQREAVRSAFYFRWYGLLLMAFSTVCTFFGLKHYFQIIRRKGLPRKSSFDIYFSTNVTSLILRWVALVIVVIGMIELWGFLLLQVFLREGNIPLSPLFNTIAALVLPTVSGLVGLLAAGKIIALILYSLLTPIALGLLTVLQSWVVLLLSEYICFVSNCYHVLYGLAHPAPGQSSRSEEAR